MKLIVITQPEFFEDEAAAITSLFDAGLEILHLRKPGASYEDMDKLLRRLPAEYMERIVTHDHFGLATELERCSSEQTQPGSTCWLYRARQPFLPFAGGSGGI